MRKPPSTFAAEKSALIFSTGATLNGGESNQQPIKTDEESETLRREQCLELRKSTRCFMSADSGFTGENRAPFLTCGKTDGSPAEAACCGAVIVFLFIRA